MKCKIFPLFLILTFLLCLSILPISADIYYNANTYVFTFPTYNTAMAFNSAMTFTDAYRENGYWYFTTVTVAEIGFQVQVATLLITDFFVTDPDILEFAVSAASGTSTTKIHVGTRGEPSDVVGETTWSYDSGAQTLTITRTHSSTHTITVDWSEAPSDTTPPTISNVVHNTTVENTICMFSARLQDNIALSGYKRSDNITGSWTNGTWTALGANPAWANFTRTLPNDGVKVGYRWYANDTSNNWLASSIYTLTTTAIGESIVVLLNIPADGSTSYTNNQSFTYTPIFYATIENASLWATVSGTWQTVAWNTTAITNNTMNTISYTFPSSGTYLWNIQVFNSSVGIFAANNRTLTKSLEPRYSSIGHSSTYANMPCTYSIIGLDGDGLSGSVLRHNVTETWQNETWQAFSGSPTEQLASLVKQNPLSFGVVVGYVWMLNDTDDRWVTTPTTTFTTTFYIPPPGPYSNPLASLWQFLVEGDLLGFLQAIYVSAFASADIFYALIAMLVLGAIYIRTHSLILISILWLLVGAVFMVALPLVAGIGVFFLILGAAGLLYQLFRPSSQSY